MLSPMVAIRTLIISDNTSASAELDIQGDT